MDAVTINISPGVAFGTCIRPPFEAPPRDGNQMGADITLVRSAPGRGQHWTSSSTADAPNGSTRNPAGRATRNSAQPDSADYQNILDGINHAKNGLESVSSQLQNCGELVAGLLTAFAIPPANASHSFDGVFSTITGVINVLNEVEQELAGKQSEQSPPAPPTPKPFPRGPVARPSAPRSHTRAAYGGNADSAQRHHLPLSDAPPPGKPMATEATRKKIGTSTLLVTRPTPPTPAVTSSAAAAHNPSDSVAFERQADISPLNPEQQLDSYAYPNKKFLEFLKNNDKKVISNSGNGNNCAIYALLQPLLSGIGMLAMADQVEAVRAEYDRKHPGEKGQMLHLDGGPGSAIDDLIGIINKRYRANILVKVVSASLDDEPYVVHGTFPKVTKLSKALPPSHHLTVWDQQRHYVAVVDPKGDNRRHFALHEID